MNSKELLSYLDIPFSFQSRPVPVQPQVRVVWGLSILVLILYLSSRGKKSSIARLHLLNWALRNSDNAEKLLSVIRSESRSLLSPISFEPGFNQAITYAISESLVKRNKSGKIFLTEKGVVLAKEVISNDDCLQHERNFLVKIKNSATESLANSLFKGILQ